jgi:hypothetical protein
VTGHGLFKNNCWNIKMAQKRTLGKKMGENGRLHTSYIESMHFYIDDPTAGPFKD